MTHVRQPAVAGMFYPGDPGQLDAVIRRYLTDAAPATLSDDRVPKAIIVPHAGYVYSGPVAAAAYARLLPARGRIRRVVLLGPCHRVPVRGLAASSADAFETPLGRVPVDKAAIEAILDLPQVGVFDATHAEEHSLEVQLPFLQEVLGTFRVVPLVVGDAKAAEVAEVLERLWDGEETLIVISSDLSHYLDYDTARAVDAATRRAIEALRPDAIDRQQACGRTPVAGLLEVARRRGLRVTTLDLRNSGDTAGDRSRVVGYGAWMFTEPAGGDCSEGEAEAASGEPAQASESRLDDPPGAATRALLESHGETLLRVAAASIKTGLTAGRPLPVDPRKAPEPLRAERATFVTLHRLGRLRGCIGSPQAYRPLIKDVADNAFAAAFGDPRFRPLAPEELPELALEVSVLSPPVPLRVASEDDLIRQLRPRVDGLIIQSNGRRALFLPQVWESLPHPEQFLAHLKAKAGLPVDHWADDFRAWRFTAEAVSSQELPDPGSLWS